MKYYVISDNSDTLTGLRLAGMEGTLARDRAEVEAALQTAADDPEIGLVLITEPLVQLASDAVEQQKLHGSRPLILAIPDRHGSGRSADFITRSIREAIGLKM